MKRIAIITLAVALENEKGYSRFRFLAELLSKYYQVDLITSTFQHWEKKQRNINEIYQINVPYNIVLAKEPGYKKNVDLRRIYSHKVATKNIIELLKKKKYDLIYCIIPDNFMAACVGEYATKNHIPYIVDIEDLWPEAMEMVFPLPWGINKIIGQPYRKAAKKAYECADAFVGTSNEYRDVPKNKYGIVDKPAITVYVGCELDEFDKGIKEYENQIEKPEQEFWITYAGNLGSSYDINTLIRAGQKLYAKGYQDIVIKIMGNGPLEKDFKKIASSQICNVDFMGYTPYKKMAAYLAKSDILVNSFVKQAPQSIVTKVGDYLAAGKPMVNTLSSPEFRKKVNEEGFGRNVEAENPEKLAKILIEMKENKNELICKGKKARKIAEEQFDRKKSYQEIYRLMYSLIGE